MNLQNWQTQLRKGLLELVILNLLSESQRHGYEMVQILKRIEGLAIREGNIYPILTRLKVDKMITSQSHPSQDGPPRKYFTLTKHGIQSLEQMNTHWEMILSSIEQIRKGKEQL